jgi:DNA-binding NarL/FixJ family response regulator
LILTKNILVAILEDDIFSRNWMALLMVRDWRTRVIGEFSTRADLCAYLDSSPAMFDVLILDVDLFGEYFTIRDICQALDAKQKTAKILLTGIEPDPKIIREFGDDRVHGYVLKGEIGYSLSWVITFVHEGYWVLTPGVQDIMLKLPSNALVLDGRKTIPVFTDHEAEVARMAFIFSVGRRDLADELRITEQWSYGLVSELYKKMGLTDIISGEVDLFAYIGESEIIRKKFDDIIAQLGTSKKARDMETLAYHLLTMPEIIQG